MNDQHLATERTAFEKEANEYFVCETENDDTEGLVLDGIGLINGEYASSRLRDAFHFWQAALAQREPVAEGEVVACVAELRAVAGWSYGKRTFAAISTAADLLERTEAARLAAEKENQKLRMGLAEISQLHFKDVADLKAQLTKENKARLTVITLANAAEENFKKELTAERARAEKLVEALNRINNMAGMKYGAFSHISFEAVKAYQSSKENGQ